MKKQTTFLIFFVTLFFAAIGFLPIDMVKVTNLQMGSWKFNDSRSEMRITFSDPIIGTRDPRHNPVNVPHGLKFHVTPDDYIDTDNYKNIKIRLSGYENKLLKDITELRYSTFTKNNNGLVPFVVLQIECKEFRYLPVAQSDGKTKVVRIPVFYKVKLVYEPRLQDVTSKQGAKIFPIEPNKWQQWDLLHGKWWLNTDDGRDPYSGAPFYTLKEFYSLRSGAKLILSDAENFNGDAIRLTAGGLGNWGDIDSYADHFIIGVKNQPEKEYYFEKE